MSDSLRLHELQPARLLCPWDSPSKNTGTGSHSFLQGIFPTQGSNPGLLHGRHNLLSEPPGKPFAHKGTEEADKSQKDRKMKARTSKVSSGDWRVTCQTATLIRLICAFSFGLGTPSYFFRKKKRTTCRKGLSFRRERSYPYLVYSYPESVLKGTWGVPASSTG